MTITNSEALPPCPLETALKKYTSWSKESIGSLPLLSNSDKDKLEYAIVHSQNGMLTPLQEYKLMEMINSLMADFNKEFNRSFKASITPLLCGDAIGYTSEEKILFFERKVRDETLLALPGGITDEGEHVTNTVTRELNEETGYGCKMDLKNISVIRDYILNESLPKISVFCVGNIAGNPLPNHEAKDFHFLLEKEIQLTENDRSFDDHLKIVKKAIQLQKFPIANGSLYYESLGTAIGDEIKFQIKSTAFAKRSIQPSLVVDEAIEKIGQVFQTYRKEFKQWCHDVLKKIDGFKESRDTLWPLYHESNSENLGTRLAYERKCNWNDHERLWDFIAPWQGRLLSTNTSCCDDELFSINKLFNANIKIREAGTVELTTLLRDQHDKFVVIKNRNNKLELLSTVQRYNENFQEALYRSCYEQLGVEITDGSTLWGLGEQADKHLYRDKLDNELRTFVFESSFVSDDSQVLSINDDSNASIELLSLEEIKRTLNENQWDERHSHLAHLILSKKLAEKL